jgi:subtilisin family serine protease
VAGIGWNTLQVLPVRALGAYASTSFEDVAAAIHYAAGIPAEDGAPVPQKAAQVINLSVGAPQGIDPALYDAVQGAVDKGITVVAAAGNGYENPVFQPASYDNTIAVSATDRQNEFAFYSSKGPQVDFAAPGGGAMVAGWDGGDEEIDAILSTGYVVDPMSSSDYYGYLWLSGTSMSTPHVSGVIGLLYSFAPNLTQDAVYAILANTARDLGDPGHDEEYGHGLIDAQAALEYLINASRDYPVQPRSVRDRNARDAAGGSRDSTDRRAVSGGAVGRRGISAAAVHSLAAQGRSMRRGTQPPKRSGAILPEPGAEMEPDSVIIKLTETAEGRGGKQQAQSLAEGLWATFKGAGGVGGADGAGGDPESHTEGGSAAPPSTAARVRPLGGRLYCIGLTAGTEVADAIEVLASHGDVEYAQPNYRYSLIGPP